MIRSAAGPPARVAALVAVVLLDATWLATGPTIRGAWAWLPLIAAVGAHTGLVVAERRRPALDPRVVVAATAGSVLVAVVLAPWGSKDVFQYAVYGHMASVHRLNPYVHRPFELGGDPLLRSTAPGWRRARTVYGPMFTAASAVAARGFGHSARLGALFFQALNGIALVGAVAFLARRRAGSDALVFVGLAPVLLAVVNGGHNDLLVGLAVLVALAFVADRRPLAAGLCLAAAALVKLLVLPAVAGVVVALLLARRGAEVKRLVAGFAAPLVAGYVAVGGLRALAPVRGGARVLTRSSLWTGVRDVLVNLSADRSDALARFAPARLGTLAVAVTVVLSLVLFVRAGRRAEPAALAVGGLVVLLLAGPYVLPWYSAAALPAAARLGDRLRWLVHAQAVLVLAVYIAPPGAGAGSVPFDRAVSAAGPWLVLVLLVAVMAWWSPGRVGRDGVSACSPCPCGSDGVGGGPGRHRARRRPGSVDPGRHPRDPP
ncbi:MAG: DUF2029 domain-containing protein [Actinobacteria bacterium]|nr:DUF2029 domain-containing protein [Actinomycetota bacterium]